MSPAYAASQVSPTELRTVKLQGRASPTNSNFTTVKSPGQTTRELPRPSAATPAFQVVAPSTPKPGGPPIYYSISRMFGFRETFSLLWFFIFGGALLGFCLGRSMTLNPRLIEGETTPGDFFWFNRPKFKVNYYLHIYLTIVGGLMVGIQFIPAVRRRAVILHRVNGYFCLFCLLPGNITGAVAAAKSFGGEVNAQSAYSFLAIAIVVCGLTGIYYVKRQTRQHRKWMLRMVAYFGAPITSRLIMFAARAIISDIGTYYSVWRCDEMMFLMTNASAAQTLYPQCFGSADPSKTFIAVHASLNEDTINLASAARVTAGMSLWLATLIHALGVEIYIRLTEDMNHSRSGYVLEPKGAERHDHLWRYGG